MILQLFILFSFIIAEPNLEKSIESTGPDHISLIVHQNLINDSSKEKFIIPITGKIYEPFAIVYYLQNLTLETNQQHLFTYYSKKNIKALTLKVLDQEEIITPYITSLCHVVVPQSPDKKAYLLKNKGEMKIWYTADEKQIPIKIQQKMRHGIMELLIIKYIEN